GRGGGPGTGPGAGRTVGGRRRRAAWVRLLPGNGRAEPLNRAAAPRTSGPGRGVPLVLPGRPLNPRGARLAIRTRPGCGSRGGRNSTEALEVGVADVALELDAGDVVALGGGHAPDHPGREAEGPQVARAQQT